MPSGIWDSESVGPGRTRRQPEARHGGGFLGTRSLRRISSGGLASVVLLVGTAGPVIVLVILAEGAGVALAAGACALAVLDVAVAAFGGGARAGD